MFYRIIHHLLTKFFKGLISAKQLKVAFNSFDICLLREILLTAKSLCDSESDMFNKLTNETTLLCEAMFLLNSFQ